MNDVYTAELPELNARPAPKGLRLAAIITGLLGFVLFLATPFLPVTQTQSSFDWPANDSLNSVTAPLISVSPEEIDAAIPVAAIDMLREKDTDYLRAQVIFRFLAKITNADGSAIFDGVDGQHVVIVKLRNLLGGKREHNLI